MEADDGKYDDKQPLYGGIGTEMTNLLWIIIYSAFAEALTSCFVPLMTITIYRINLSSTMLNVLGGYLEGVVSTMEHGSDEESIRIMCSLFRTGFLGVFTSYSYMVEHAGDLTEHSIFMGPFYILGTLVISCYAFVLGKMTAHRWIRQKKTPRSNRSLQNPKLQSYPRIFLCIFSFVICTLMRASFGERGFVRDPNDPQFVGAFKIDDGLELLVGMVLSSVAILLSQRIGVNPANSTIDWGVWRCNVLSCFLALVAYSGNYFSDTFGRNFIVIKFITSFCGSLSCFSATIGTTMVLWYQDRNKQHAAINFGVNLITALLFIPYFNSVG